MVFLRSILGELTHVLVELFVCVNFSQFVLVKHI